MIHNDDAFTAMLLTVPVTPDREELARPLSPLEFARLNDLAIKTRPGSLGALIDIDMSGLMLRYGMKESDAYRVCLLLGRNLPLSLLIERLAEADIELVTLYNAAYPQRVRDALGDKAPPTLFLRGRPEMFRQSAVAILGSVPPKGEAEAHVRALVRQASNEDYVILTDGMTGLGRIAEDEAFLCGGRVISFLSGALMERIQQPMLSNLIDERRGAAVSPLHPEALPTLSHGTARGRCLYAQAEAAFVFGCEHKKGDTWQCAVDALRDRNCRHIYAWDTPLYSGNRPLMERGALPFAGPVNFSQMARIWRVAQAEQLSFFEWEAPRPR
jgi:predicted Rossmann fold nucleotide-binding protein DprA/Smf involved in DNA uptake